MCDRDTYFQKPKHSYGTRLNLCRGDVNNKVHELADGKFAATPIQEGDQTNEASKGRSDQRSLTQFLEEKVLVEVIIERRNIQFNLYQHSMSSNQRKWQWCN